jgi:hypothetical protein
MTSSISIEVVGPNRVETTIQPEPGWRTHQPYTFVHPSLDVAVDELPGLYRELQQVQLDPAVR